MYCRRNQDNLTAEALNRLAEAINPLPSNPLETYNYDPVGNWTDSNQNGLAALIRRMSFLVGP